MKHLMKAKTTFEFDKYFTFKFIHDWSEEKSSKDYYKDFSCLDYLDKINTPVLFLHIKNDPIVTYEDLPM